MLAQCVVRICSEALTSMDLADWISSGISICTLLLNILFYIIIAPRINFRFQKKENFLKCSADFLDYLSKVNSMESFDGVPTKVKSYCVTIDLLFKSGSAPNPLHDCMEAVFQLVKKRKNMTEDKDIWKWEQDFRSKTHELRVYLAKYTGVF